MQRQLYGYPSRGDLAFSHLFTGMLSIMPAIELTRLALGTITENNSPLYEILAGALASTSLMLLLSAHDCDFDAKVDREAFVDAENRMIRNERLPAARLYFFSSRDRVHQSHHTTMLNVGLIFMACTAMYYQRDSFASALAAMLLIRLCMGDIRRANLRDFDSDVPCTMVRGPTVG